MAVKKETKKEIEIEVKKADVGTEVVDSPKTANEVTTSKLNGKSTVKSNTKEMPRLKKEYLEKFKAELIKENEIKNVMLVPNLEKIVVNVGVGEAIREKSLIDDTILDIITITGQKPVVTLAKAAIATFKIRQGDAIGVKVTLRGDRMWEFFDKLVNVVFPRTKDFRGLSPKAFDGNGNYSLGIKEHTVFPEINPNEIKRIRSLEVTLSMTTKEDRLAKAFLDKFGFPFWKDGKKV